MPLTSDPALTACIGGVTWREDLWLRLKNRACDRLNRHCCVDRSPRVFEPPSHASQLCQFELQLVARVRITTVIALTTAASRRRRPSTRSSPERLISATNPAPWAARHEARGPDRHARTSRGHRAPGRRCPMGAVAQFGFQVGASFWVEWAHRWAAVQVRERHARPTTRKLRELCFVECSGRHIAPSPPGSGRDQLAAASGDTSE